MNSGDFVVVWLPYRVVPFRMRGTCGCTKWKVALHWMCCLTFSKLSLFRNALLQCEIHIVAKSNNPQQGRFVTIALLKYILFLINSVWVVSFLFVLFVVFNPFPICSQGVGNLISRFSPGAGGFGMIWSGPLLNPPICPGSGGWGFQLTCALASAYWLKTSTHEHAVQKKTRNQVAKTSWTINTLNIHKMIIETSDSISPSEIYNLPGFGFAQIVRTLSQSLMGTTGWDDFSKTTYPAVRNSSRFSTKISTWTC